MEILKTYYLIKNYDSSFSMSRYCVGNLLSSHGYKYQRLGEILFKNTLNTFVYHLIRLYYGLFTLFYCHE